MCTYSQSLAFSSLGITVLGHFSKYALKIQFNIIYL